MRVIAACGGLLAVRQADLPHGVHPLPGPAWLVAERAVSPRSGPYLTLRVWVPAQRRSRFPWWPAIDVVSTPEADLAVTSRPATLRWWADASSVEVIWEEADVAIRATSVSPRLARLAKVEVRVGSPCAVSWLAGRHVGMIVSGLQPVAGWSPIVRWRAARNRPPAEPALAGGSGSSAASGYSSPSRAYSSVG